MGKRVLVGGVSAKLTQFSWGGGGECPDHTASPAEEPTSRMDKHAGSLSKKKVTRLFIVNSPHTHYISILSSSNFEEMVFSKNEIFSVNLKLFHLNLLNYYWGFLVNTETNIIYT